MTVFISGGAYQGKLDFVKETFGITDSDVHICSEGRERSTPGGKWYADENSCHASIL